MTAHREFADDLALYAVGALDPAERPSLEAHLKECLECRHELEELRGDAALLALSVPGYEPPAHARQRLLTAIGAKPRVVRSPKITIWRTLVPWMAAIALGGIALTMLRKNADLRRQIAAVANNLSQQEKQLHDAQMIVATLTDPQAARYTLTAANAKPQPQGKAIYQRSRRSLIFFASNMPALPPQKTYELWLIPNSGAPIPAGLFKPDANGAAALVNAPLTTGVEAKAFAISVEPENGSPAPTSTPIMVGTGG